jgi:hypothetical protein
MIFSESRRTLSRIMRKARWAREQSPARAFPLNVSALSLPHAERA